MSLRAHEPFRPIAVISDARQEPGWPSWTKKQLMGAGGRGLGAGGRGAGVGSEEHQIDEDNKVTAGLFERKTRRKLLAQSLTPLPPFVSWGGVTRLNFSTVGRRYRLEGRSPYFLTEGWGVPPYAGAQRLSGR